MKILPLLIITILFLSCHNSKPTNNNHFKNKSLQPIDTNNLQKANTHLSENDSAKEPIIEKSDIKIIRATIVKNPYSDHKDIEIVFKNQGKKTIKAIQFEWLCINSFDEPANGKYFYGEGKYKEKSVHLLKPHEIQTEHWEDFSTDANKITEIRATYIVYTDGTKWRFNNENDSL